MQKKIGKALMTNVWSFELET